MPHIMIIKNEEKAGSVQVPGLCGSPGRGLQLPDEEDDRSKHEEERQEPVEQCNLTDSFRRHPAFSLQSAQSEQRRLN